MKYVNLNNIHTTKYPKTSHRDTAMKCCLILATLFLSFSSSPLPKIKVRSDGHYVDESGRVRIFHGFNAVNKGFPWYPEQMSNVSIVKSVISS